MRRITGLMAGAAVLMVVMQAGISAQQTQQVQSWQQRLDLTDEQKAEINQISERHREAALEAQSALIQARADLNKLMLETDPDLRDMERVMNALSQLENAQKIQSIRNRAEIMEVLPEDQRLLFNRTAGFLGARRAMSSRSTGFDRGRGTIQGRSRSGRERSAMSGYSGLNRGRGSMPGRAGSWRGGNTGMMNRGRMIPPVPQNDEQFNRQGMMMGRGMVGGRGRGSVAPPPPPPPPAG